MKLKYTCTITYEETPFVRYYEAKIENGYNVYYFEKYFGNHDNPKEELIKTVINFKKAMKIKDDDFNIIYG